MPYGAGRRLGDTVRPELGAYDYSGVEHAGQSLGQGFADIGQGLKQRSNEKKQIEKSLKLAKDIGELIPELQPQAQEAISMMIDPNRSHRDQLAIAEGIKDTLNIGMMMKDDQYKQRALDLEAMRTMASMRGDGEPYSILSPQEMDAYTQAGYQMPEVYRLPDGNFQVKMARKPPSPGGMSIVAGPDGGMQFVPTGGSSFGKTPGYEAMGLPSSVPPNQGGMAPMDGMVLPPRNDSNAPPPDIAPWAVDAYGYTLQQPSQPAGSSPLEQAVGGFGAGGMFGGKVPGEILKVDAQGRPIGATQVPGTQAALNYKRGEQALLRDASAAKLDEAKALTEQQKAQDAIIKREKQSSDVMSKARMDIQDINYTRNLLSKQIQGRGVGPGVARKVSEIIPGSATDDISLAIQGVKSRLKTQEITKMRQYSPTGAAVGNVSDADMRTFESLLGSLDARMNPADLDRTMTRIQNMYADMLHGTLQEREQALKDGKITPAQMMEAERDYAPMELSNDGKLVPRQLWKGPDSNIAPDVNELINKYRKQ